MKRLIRKLIEWAFKEDFDAINKYRKILLDSIEDRNTEQALVDEIYKNSKSCLNATKVALDYVNQMASFAECDVDFHEKGKSWAVISLKGKKKMYLKFIDLDDKNLQEIIDFLKPFGSKHIDASPSVSPWIESHMI